MESDASRTFLFEVSWEICNKVGGIYAVVSSKALQAVDHYGEDVFLLGPDMKNNAEFEETEEACWDKIRLLLVTRGLKCRLGRWNIPGRPKAILVDFTDRYNSNQLLYDLWGSYGVDSLSGGWDYIEPVMFSYACGEVIAALHDGYVAPQKAHSVAHFHEWMCGAGLLAVKKLAPSVGTVFTTHATMLGRALAGSGVDIYKQMRQINPLSEASAHNITAKCSMESIAAREADCFTTVSHITSEEASAFLGRTPNMVTTNGLDMRIIPDYSEDRASVLPLRQKVLDAVEPILHEKLPENTRIFVISGRYEYHNKGIDVFLEALASVSSALQESGVRVLALCLVMGGHTGLNVPAATGEEGMTDNGQPFLSPFHVWNSKDDAIINACRRFGLNNHPGDAVQVLFVPAMLTGDDGFFNMPYYDILAASDLGVFPSWYEPWGYTPHESAAFAVPTVTTDLSGFGLWVKQQRNVDVAQSGVTVIPRHHTRYDDVVEALRNSLLEHATCTKEVRTLWRKNVRALTDYSSWEKFFPKYIAAYSFALEQAEKRNIHLDHLLRQEKLHHVLTPTSSTIPHLRPVTAVVKLPKELARLHELTHNMWWSTSLLAKALFISMNPKIWSRVEHNPLRLLEELDAQRLQDMVQHKEFMQYYAKTLEEFDAYMALPPMAVNEHLTPERPVAYFSTEYGLHESLPIYSGGLGVLSGDHLKSASDLRLPLVAVGLLYKNGYFRQQLDKDGKQIAHYPINNFSQLPVECITDRLSGKPILVELDFPGRTLYAQIWRVRVGRISLYLMDTDITANTEGDRQITARLYEADRTIRLQQEILLGMGGIRMLRTLGITPSVFHMNEGHSAFLTIERARTYIQEQGLSFVEAFERVRSNTIFTTHTPVDAGNERFNMEHIKHYFSDCAKSMGLSWSEFARLGSFDNNDRSGSFEMTVLALKASSHANGVSRLHGIVSQHMWRDLWKGVPIPEIPIGHVTNGIHTPSYVGLPIKTLLDTHLGEQWLHATPEDPIWNGIDAIPFDQYWGARMQQKEGLLDALRHTVNNFMQKHDIHQSQRYRFMEQLQPETLIIGFARRFAPYKRATLLFADPDRLERMLNTLNRPVIIVFAGKAHPADQAGIELIQQVIRYAQEERFLGRIFFLEDYSLAISRVMAQGCDVWLNTPRRPHEASGTSGQKVPVNGGINLSVSDGWWCEGYNRENGWTIGPVVTTTLPSNEYNDYADAASLYELLEKSVIPLYFETDRDGIPHGWVKISKNSMRTLTSMYSSERMLCDYTKNYYAPTALRNRAVTSNNKAVIRHIAAWKQNIPMRFASLAIKEITVSGIANEIVACGQAFNIAVSISPGDMDAQEILVQFVFGPINSNGDYTQKPVILDLVGTLKEDILVYEGQYTAKNNGRYAYGIRVMPITEGLASPLESGLVLWG